MGFRIRTRSARALRHCRRSSVDPCTLNETFTPGFLDNIHSGPDLTIGPALAERREVAAPDHWRFCLGRGVRFYRDETFTAEGMLFSAGGV